MSIGDEIGRVVKVANILTDVQRAFDKIKLLEENQKRLAELLDNQDKRLREVEAGLREARGEILHEAGKEAREIVTGAQTHLAQKLSDLERQTWEIARDMHDAKGLTNDSDGTRTSRIGTT